MYKVPNYKKSSIQVTSNEIGTHIHEKVKAIIEQGDNTNEAPLIYTDKADGVMAGYNIRTDKWEVAIEAMDAINKVRFAKGEARRGKVVEMKPENTNSKTEENGESKDS